jgi:hypothetical protein
VLTGQALGRPAASSADIAAAQSRVGGGEAVQVATAIKLVADAGVALPNGVTDTLALVSDPATLAAFTATELGTNASLYAATLNAVLADGSLAVAPTVPVAGDPDVEIITAVGQGAALQGAMRLVLKGDGTATLARDQWAETGKWTLNDSQITVAYDHEETYESSYDGGGTAIVHVTGFKLRQLGGTPGIGPATTTDVAYHTFEYGASAGTSETDADAWTPTTMLATTQPFSASEFAVGTEWAGTALPDWESGADTLKVVDAQHVLYERAQVTGTFEIVDGSLIVRSPAGVMKYSRLFVAQKGEDRWLTEQIVDGASAWAFDAPVVKVTGGLGFSTESLAHAWLSNFDDAFPTGPRTSFIFNADSTVTESITAAMGEPAMSMDGTWSIGADGTATLSLSQIGYTFKLLGVSGDTMYVLVNKFPPGSDPSAVNHYRVVVLTNVDS